MSALERVLDDSEVAELWRETGDDTWEDEVRQLAVDLRGRSGTRS